MLIKEALFLTCLFLFCSTSPINCWQECEVEVWWGATVTPDSEGLRQNLNCLGGMLIFLNTFQGCQILPAFPYYFVCMSLFYTYSHSHYSLSVLFFFFYPDSGIWNQWIHPYITHKLLNFMCCLSHCRQLQQSVVGWSPYKTGTFHQACNDRQQSAFRVPAFITVNVDDTDLLWSWQNCQGAVKLAQSLVLCCYDHLFHWWMPTFWEQVSFCVCGHAQACVCVSFVWRKVKVAYRMYTIQLKHLSFSTVTNIFSVLMPHRL